MNLQDKYEGYITQFIHYKSRYDKSFIRFENEETEIEKESIIKYFAQVFKDYRFYFSVKHTAFFYELKQINQ